MVKKVAHLTSVHNITDDRIFYKECISLRKAGFEVILIGSAKKNTIVRGVKIIAVKRHANRLLRIIKTTWDVYKKAKKVNADIYHFHDPELIFIALLLRLKSKKVIYDVHENVPKQILNKRWIPKLLRPVIAKIFEIFENFSIKKFSAVITSEIFVKDRFLKIKNNKIFNIKNYPILEEFNFNNVKKQTAKQLCYVGGITKERGIYEMMEGAYKSNVPLVLCGEFCPMHLDSQLKNNNYWKSVRYMGFVNRTRIVKIIQESKIGMVLLHPISDYKDSFPIKMFEYMAAGIPVIASNFPLWRSIVEDNNCGICVDPFDMEAIVAAIKYILSHPKEAKIMGDNGQRAILEKFNWNNEAKKLVAIYKEVLECK